MMDDYEREIKRMRLECLGDRIDYWVWSNIRRFGTNDAAHLLGLEAETVAAVRQRFHRRGRA